jgi:hypothetical protein
MKRLGTQDFWTDRIVTLLLEIVKLERIIEELKEMPPIPNKISFYAPFYEES